MIPLAKNIKRYFSLKNKKAFLAGAIVISCIFGLTVYSYFEREVTINDNGNQIAFKTMKTTVKAALDERGITINRYDYISLPLESELQKTNQNDINIKRAIPINVVADGKETRIFTSKDNVKEALVNSEIKLKDIDRIEGAKLTDPIVNNMKLKVIRVKEEVVSEKSPIPFNLITRSNNQLDKGKEKTLVEGKQGLREKTFKIVFEDGKETARSLLKESIVVNPVHKVVELGTVLNIKTSRGDIVRYNRALDMSATAYTSSYKDTGKHPGHPEFGITCTGTKARRGIIAVDPKVIPLGTKVYVKGVGNVPDYGYAVAGDVGGAIKGNKIDLYFDDQSTVDRWGRKKVKVYILKN